MAPAKDTNLLKILTTRTSVIMSHLTNLSTVFGYKEFQVEIEQSEKDSENFDVSVSLLNDFYFHIAYIDNLNDSLKAAKEFIDRGLFVNYLDSWLRVSNLEGCLYAEIITSEGDHVTFFLKTVDECWNKMYSFAERHAK